MRRWWREGPQILKIVVNRLPSLFVVLLEAIETPLTKGTFLCIGMGTGREFSGSPGF